MLHIFHVVKLHFSYALWVCVRKKLLKCLKRVLTRYVILRPQMVLKIGVIIRRHIILTPHLDSNRSIGILGLNCASIKR